MRKKISDRLASLKHLRKMDAPLWVIRSEQVSLACLRKGLRTVRIGKPASGYQYDLIQKYVIPLMGL